MAAEGEFALVRQNLEQALETTGHPVQWGSVGHDHDLYALLADVAAQQRDLDALRRYTPLAEVLAARDEHTLYRAIAHRAWGVAHRLAGEYSQAEARFNQALDLFERLDTRWQIGRTCHELAELSEAQMDTAGAREYFSRALAAFEELRAAPDAERARMALETLAAFD